MWFKVLSFLATLAESQLVNHIAGLAGSDFYLTTGRSINVSDLIDNNRLTFEITLMENPNDRL